MTMRQLVFLACTAFLIGCVPEGSQLDRGPPIGTEQPAKAGNVRALLNAERAARGLRPVRRSSQLTAAARAHARDMSANGYFSHQGRGGQRLGDRVLAQRYWYCTVAENIAKGQRSERQVIDGWMRSSGHRRNILNPRVTEFGFAHAAGNYWVLVLARPGC